MHLQGAPQAILETHKLSGLTLEYRRECGKDSVLKSLGAISGNDIESAREVECQHLLQLESGAEIVRARTQWRPKSTMNEGGATGGGELFAGNA